MKSSYKNLLKDTLVFSIGSLGSKLILFLMVPLYTNYMSDAEYGTAELVFTIAQLMAPFISVVIFDAVIRFGLSRNEKKENVILVGAVVFLISAAVGLFITPIVGLYEAVSHWKWYLYAYVVVNIANSIELNYIKAKGYNKAFALLGIAQTALMAGLNVLFLVKQNMGIQGYLLAYILANVVIDIIALFIGRIPKDLRNAHFDNRLFKEMIWYSAPLIFNNVSWWIIHSSDKIMVEVMISASALGIYTVAAKIPSLINVIVTIFQQAWGISSVREIETTNDTAYYSNVFKYYVLFTSGACLALVSIIRLFMRYYVGNDFQDAWKYVPLLLVSAVYASIASYYGSLYGALKKSVNNMLTTLAAAAVNIIVNVIFIPIVGIWGAVIGTVVSYMVLAFARMFDVGRYIKITVEYRKLLANMLLIIAQAVLVSFEISIVITSSVCIFLFLINNYPDLKSLVVKKKQ